jgi:hypothetical protein
MNKKDKWFLWFLMINIMTGIQWHAHYVRDGVNGVNLWLDVVLPSILFGVCALVNLLQTEDTK